MRTRTVLLFALGLALFLALLSCGAPPQPAVVATPIPSLIPATLPPQPTATLLPASLSIALPSRRPSAQAAQPVYEQNCATCHGSDGRGTVPRARNFADVDYLRGETPLRLYQIISDGRGSMPGWADKLSVDERWDLAFYVWNFVASSEVLEQGKTVYEQNCMACHSADGTGAVPGTPDFTNIAWMASRAPRDFFKVLTEGQGGMPSWQGKLTPEERWASIEYIRTFSTKQATSTAKR